MHFRPRLLCVGSVYVFRLDGIVRGAASLAWAKEITTHVVGSSLAGIRYPG